MPDDLLPFSTKTRDHDQLGRVRACRVAFRSAGRTLAVATIGRDLDSLRADLELQAAGPPNDAQVEL